MGRLGARDGDLGVGRLGQAPHPLAQCPREAGGEVAVDVQAVVGAVEIANGEGVVTAGGHVLAHDLGTLDDGHGGVGGAVGHEHRLVEFLEVGADVEVHVLKSTAGDLRTEGTGDCAEHPARDVRVV